MEKEVEKLKRELNEAKQLIHKAASGLVQERENMLAEVLGAQAERDKWRTMAQELAADVSKAQHKFRIQFCHDWRKLQECKTPYDAALSRFNELNTSK